MDNQALAVLIAVTLFGAVAIGVIAHNDVQDKTKNYQYSSISKSYASN